MLQQSSFLSVFKYNFGGQICTRVASFLLNLYLIRAVDPSLLGLMNVRMTLLYSTIVFLSKEPFRKVSLSPSLAFREAYLCSLLSVPFCLCITLTCSFVWWTLVPSPDLDTKGADAHILISFASSAFITGLVEPVVLLAIKTGDNAHHSFANGVMALAAKVLTLCLLYSSVDPIYAFCWAQIGGSALYALLNWRYFITQLQPQMSGKSVTIAELKAYIRGHTSSLLMISTMVIHSLLKQLINSGSEYVMTFTNILPLKIQAVYDAVEKLVGLVVRMVLTPVEESAAIYFSSSIHRREEKESQPTATASTSKPTAKATTSTGAIPEKVVDVFVALLRLTTILGLVVCIFAVSYSKLAVKIYGGSMLVENDGAKFLSLYTIYLLLISINGITECFAFALMDNAREIFNHGAFLFAASAAHLILNAILCSLLGAPGFILANCISTALRIVYNWRLVRGRLGNNAQSLRLTSFLPTTTLFFLLLFALFSTTLSLLLFGSVEGLIHSGAHVAMGGVMLVFVLGYLYQSGELAISALADPEKSD